MPNSQIGKKIFPATRHTCADVIPWHCMACRAGILLGIGWFYFSNKAQQMEDVYTYSRFCDHYCVTHLHAPLLSADQKYFNHVILGTSTCQARGWSASLDEVKGKILEDFSKARNVPWGLQQQTPKCSHKSLLNKNLSVRKMAFFRSPYLSARTKSLLPRSMSSGHSSWFWCEQLPPQPLTG